MAPPRHAPCIDFGVLVFPRPGLVWFLHKLAPACAKHARAFFLFAHSPCGGVGLGGVGTFLAGGGSYRGIDCATRVRSRFCLRIRDILTWPGVQRRAFCCVRSGGGDRPRDQLPAAVGHHVVRSRQTVGVGKSAIGRARARALPCAAAAAACAGPVLFRCSLTAARARPDWFVLGMPSLNHTFSEAR